MGNRFERFSGDSYEDTPVPMPNTVVKLINAESTWPEAAREDRKLLIKRNLAYMRGIFLCAKVAHFSFLSFSMET